MSLREIATDLGKLYGTRGELRIKLAHLEADQAGREQALVPAEGWPGKNDDARKAAKVAALAGDETLRRIRTEHDVTTAALIGVDEQINAREAERRGLEWEIRERLARALSGRQNAPGAVEDTAFDDAVDAAVDDELPF